MRGMAAHPVFGKQGYQKDRRSNPHSQRDRPQSGLLEIRRPNPSHERWIEPNRCIAVLSHRLEVIKARQLSTLG